MNRCILWIVVALGALLSSCLPDPFRGSQVVLELGTQNQTDIANRATEHYELFAVLDGGLVSVGRFFIDETLVITTFTGQDIQDEKKLGVAIRSSPDGLPQGGMEITTEANLAGAQELFLTLERNGDSDPAPSDRVVGRAVLDSARRSVLFGELIGEVPVLGGRTVPLTNSRAAVVLGEHEVED